MDSDLNEIYEYFNGLLELTNLKATVKNGNFTIEKAGENCGVFVSSEYIQDMKAIYQTENWENVKHRIINEVFCYLFLNLHCTFD